MFFRFSIFIFFVFIFINGSSQNIKKYKSFIYKAEKLHVKRYYHKSIFMYQKAFESLSGKAYPQDRYNLAGAFSMVSNLDSAFYHLNYLAKNRKVNYKKYDKLIADTIFNNLYEDQRWEEFLSLVKENKETADRVFDSKLANQLDEVYFLDQHLRLKLDTIESKFGRSSFEYEHARELIDNHDSLNIIIVKKILDESGWLGTDVIGVKGNSALFLVIQHSKIEIQQKYLPMMRDAVQKGKAKANDIALLEDRVAMRLGEKQIYGSQIRKDFTSNKYYVYPTLEPEKVNERRKSMNLGPIEDYVKIWNIKWNVKKHKKRKVN